MINKIGVDICGYGYTFKAVTTAKANTKGKIIFI